MKPELTTNEKKFTYSKYFDQPMAPIPQEKLDILAGGPLSEDKMLKLTERAKLFEPGYLEGETGYGVMADGTGYVANLTYMPGVTKEMFEWWFAWHCLEDARYKIWDPEDHYYARTQDVKTAMNKALPMRERTWGTTHEVREDMGNGPQDMIIEFKKPSEMGYPEELVGTDRCASIMCANVHGTEPGKGMPVVMTHMIREVEGGIELRSRFWLGYQLLWGMTMKQTPKGFVIPELAVKGVLLHNMKEYTNLAAILPSVYEEEKDRF